MKLEWYEQLFHGSYKEIKEPDLSFSREDVDFGTGFYLTNDPYMAKKWACSKTNSFLNEYSLNINGLLIYTFSLDEEWLNYIRANRNYGEDIEDILEKYSHYDVIIGPTADDKLYDTVQEYLDEEIDAETAVAYLNAAGFSEQVVLKSKKAIEQLHFTKSKEIKGLEKKQYKQATIQDRTKAREKLKELKRQALLKQKGFLK